MSDLTEPLNGPYHSQEEKQTWTTNSYRFPCAPRLVGFGIVFRDRPTLCLRELVTPLRGTMREMQAGKVRSSAAAPSVDYSASALAPRLAAPGPALPSAAALVLCRADARVKELPTRSIGPRIAIAWLDGSASGAAPLSRPANASAVASSASLAGLRTAQMRPQAFSCCNRTRRAASGRCRIASWRQALAASCGFRS